MKFMWKALAFNDCNFKLKSARSHNAKRQIQEIKMRYRCSRENGRRCAAHFAETRQVYRQSMMSNTGDG